MRFARRLDAVPPYLFAELERKIAEKRATGVDVISLGIGDPDLPSPAPVVDAMQRAVADPATHRYPTNQGLPAFREAVAEFYADRFGVTIDPVTEAIPVLGGKEGWPISPCLPRPRRRLPVSRARISALHVRPGVCGGDGALPAAPAGARLHAGPDEHSRGAFGRREPPLPELPQQPDRGDGRPGLLRGSGGVRREHDLIVIHDASYTELAFDGHRPPSFLETPGAREVGAEVFSLSKGWNLTGWRIGWIAGNDDVVERYRQLKTNLDSGMFEAIQLAGVAALREARSFPKEMSEIYRRRRDLMVGALTAIGLPAKPPQATPYIWVGVPEGHRRPALPSSSWRKRASSSRPAPRSGRAGKASCGSP